MTDVPADRWDGDALFSADPDAPNRIISRSGGFLEERRAGMPAKLWFRVRPEAVGRALQAHANPVRR